MARLLSLLPISLALLSSEAVPMAIRAAVPEPLPEAPADQRLVPAVAPVPAEATDAPGRGLVIDQAVDGLFYVQAEVNGAPVQFVVDTGSSVVILSAPDAARAGVGADAPVRVETAGGAAAMRRARIDRVVLAGRNLSSVEAAIVGKGLDVSLLGQSALSQLGSVTFRGRRLELR